MVCINCLGFSNGSRGRVHLPSRRHRFDPWVGKIPWRKKWPPTQLFLPGEFHGQRSLTGPSPWDCKLFNFFTSIFPHNLSCLLLLSRFSRVWLCATPQMAAHQAPPSLGFSRQEHWSGLLNTLLKQNYILNKWLTLFFGFSHSQVFSSSYHDIWSEVHGC